jgi:hypothetical protein
MRFDDNSCCSVGQKHRNMMQRWALFYILDRDALNNALPQLEISVQRTVDTRLDDMDRSMPPVVRSEISDFKAWEVLRLCTPSGSGLIAVLTIPVIYCFVLKQNPLFNDLSFHIWYSLYGYYIKKIWALRHASPAVSHSFLQLSLTVRVDQGVDTWGRCYQATLYIYHTVTIHAFCVPGQCQHEIKMVISGAACFPECSGHSLQLHRFYKKIHNTLP